MHLQKKCDGQVASPATDEFRRCNGVTASGRAAAVRRTSAIPEFYELDRCTVVKGITCATPPVFLGNIEIPTALCL